ncbi:PstS family phosphate ABC transporter substrate-binding protein [Halalkalicoccus jeotgali]|nr:PstS family phosphate ABC transporter substrate-binding protein [Halalkalicoccus jeotgali]ADJ15692.1 phosphate ABC transporter phosphate-binding protein [Halalkalicoccus jeotgali B3]
MADDPSKTRVEAVSRRELLATGGAAVAISIAGCSGGNGGEGGNGSGGSSSGNGSGSGSVSGQVIIAGSSTVYPISQAMAEEFQRENPDVNISVDSTGTGGGFENAFIPGDSDINGASREISEEEQQAAEENDITPIEMQVGSDALTFAVNNNADWVDCVTFEELAQIWGPNGAQQWSDVRDDWPDQPFELYGPATTSGTFDFFTETVIGEGGSHRSDYESTEQDNIIVQGIEGSENAMGYFGYAYYDENQDRIKGLSIDGGNGSCVEPSLETAQAGDYPLARPLFIYVSESSLQENQAVEEFVRFYINNSSSDLVSEIGYVPANESMVEENLSTIDEVVGGGASGDSGNASNNSNDDSGNASNNSSGA